MLEHLQSPYGIGLVLAVIGLVLYIVDCVSKERGVDVLEALKMSLLSGLLGFGAVSIYSAATSAEGPVAAVVEAASQTAASVSQAAQSAHEMVFSGMPTF